MKPPHEKFLRTQLLKSNLQKGNSNASKYSYCKRNTSNFPLNLPESNVVSFMYFHVPEDPNVSKWEHNETNKLKQNLKKGYYLWFYYGK